MLTVNLFWKYDRKIVETFLKIALSIINWKLSIIKRKKIEKLRWVVNNLSEKSDISLRFLDSFGSDLNVSKIFAGRWFFDKSEFLVLGK